ncbi:sigma-70 family RNA polymerase sigma factor [Amycolatopsis minnesotensis]|uniref:RNA polymerase sigma factor n=2 Tax=Amycolatopsis minnesotensis TaxID=337894 RepID=A0ABN2RMS4_9PSEU
MLSPVSGDFLDQADPYRRELMAHCYRMLGSVHDAEDLVQETYLRAWRGYDRFEGRSSLRTWLYRIATSACLTALEGRSRRPMPTGLGGSSDPGDELIDQGEVPWLEPIPDRMTDPASVVGSRESLRLALVAALQHLPPRQRAVLVLRDVIQWRAAEVADAVGITTAAANSILQRARAQLARVRPAEDTVTEPADAEQRALLDRYAAAMERKDIATIVELCTDDVVWEMPPFGNWYLGPEAVGQHLALRCPGKAGDLRLLPIEANGQPGLATYLRGPDGRFHAFNLQVFTITSAGISHVGTFLDVALFAKFELPESLPADHEPAT